MKKILPKFNFKNTEKIAYTQENIINYWARVIETLRNRREPINLVLNPTRNYNIMDLLPPYMITEETDILYEALANEDGWYTNGTYESTFIKIEMKKFKFIPPKKSRRRRNR